MCSVFDGCVHTTSSTTFLTLDLAFGQNRFRFHHLLLQIVKMVNKQKYMCTVWTLNMASASDSFTGPKIVQRIKIYWNTTKEGNGIAGIQIPSRHALTPSIRIWVNWMSERKRQTDGEWDSKPRQISQQRLLEISKKRLWKDAAGIWATQIKMKRTNERRKKNWLMP